MNHYHTLADGIKCRAIYSAARAELTLDNGETLTRSEFEVSDLITAPRLKTTNDWTRDELQRLGEWMRDNDWDDEFRSLRWLEKPDHYIDLAWLAGCDVEAE